AMEGFLRAVQLGLGPDLLGDVVRKKDDHAVASAYLFGAQLDDLFAAFAAAAGHGPGGHGSCQKPFCLGERNVPQAPVCGGSALVGPEHDPVEPVSLPVELVPARVAEGD